MRILPLRPGNLDQPDQGLDRLDLTEKGLLVGEWMMAPVLQQPLCGRRDPPISAARQITPVIYMTADFIDDRIVVVGLKVEASLGSSALALGLRHRHHEFRGPATGNRRLIQRLPMFIQRVEMGWLLVGRVEDWLFIETRHANSPDSLDHSHTRCAVVVELQVFYRQNASASTDRSSAGQIIKTWGSTRCTL